MKTLTIKTILILMPLAFVSGNVPMADNKPQQPTHKASYNIDTIQMQIDNYKSLIKVNQSEIKLRLAEKGIKVD
tara:strand:+ start:404 stop:625 length:222 start_codon:yes stop_codon:yes gene_type:complete